MVEQIQIDPKILADQLLRQADASRAKKSVIYGGDSEIPAPMERVINDPGKIIIYEVRTGEPSVVLRNMLGQLLQVTENDGTLRFSLSPSSKRPIRGTSKCLLHPDSPDRQHYDQLSLPVCKKSNMPGDYMVLRHMQKKHPTAWAIIEAERKEKERQEDREFQRGILTGIQERTKNPLAIPSVAELEELKKTTKGRYKKGGNKDA